MATTFTLYMHKALILTRKTRDHPLMVGMLFFLLFLYRFVPSLFFFLVSATPVIACTGVLLGVVLSHGEPNVPMVAVEEECERLRRTRHGIANLRSGVVGGEVFVEKSGGVVMEKDLVFGYEGCVSSSSSDGGEELEKEGGDDGAKEEEVENFGFVPISKEVEGNGESSDSDSDSDLNSDKSSSPDASMAEIMPMLDELHPLLDSEPSQGLVIASVEDNAGSEEWEDEKVENAEMEDDEEDEEEEDKQGGNGDGEGSIAVVWTKEDDKNLALLGNSELERNRRLENLIARRRMRNSFKMLSEKNLIDFEGGGDAQPAPITTARSNPFDLHCDSNNGTDLPPIPGSAPSVLAKMRNPFDIPYDPLEEKPNLAGGKGIFEEEFPASHEKDAHFRRYESFSTGSYLEKTVSKFRPYFVPSERTAYSALQRQMSEISEAKTETESVTSPSDQDYHKNKNDQEVSQSAPRVEHADHVKLESSSSGEADAGEIEQEHHRGSAEETESVSLASDQDTHSIDLVERVRDDVKLESSSSEEAEIEENLHERESASVETEPVASDATDLNLKPEETQPSVDDSVDSQPKEPVYDSHWSPSEAENTLSGITIIQEALSYMNKKILASPDVPVEAQSSSGVVEHKEFQEQSSPTDVRDPVDESCEVLDGDSSNDSIEVGVKEHEPNTNQPEKNSVAEVQDIEADGKDESARSPSEAASCIETNEIQKNVGVVQGTCETNTSVNVLEARSEVEASSISKEPARTESEYGWAEIIAKVIELEVKPNFRNELAGGSRKSFKKSKSGVRETYEDSSSSTSTAVVNDASTAVVNDPCTTEVTDNEESGESSSGSGSSSSSSDSDCTMEITDNEESGDPSSGSSASSSSSDSD